MKHFYAIWFSHFEYSDPFSAQFIKQSNYFITHCAGPPKTDTHCSG